jgi:hypothetical protein
MGTNMPSGTDLPLVIGFDAEWVRDGERRNRVLSYQMSAIAGDQTWDMIFYAQEHRGSLKLMLRDFIQEGLKHRCITRWPITITLLAHWTRGDLSACSDFPKIKSQFDNVRNTYVMTTKPWCVRVNASGHPREFQVVLRDTILLAPGARPSLAEIGNLCGIKKLDPGEVAIPDPLGGPPQVVPYIERMDLLLANDPDRYKEYAIVDARICARYGADLLKIVREDFGCSMLPPTLGHLDVQHLLNTWKRTNIAAGDVLGFTMVQEVVYDRKLCRYRRRRPAKQHHPLYDLHREVPTAAFHGGRNECFWFGPTPKGLWFEHDIASAYPIALATIRLPDYERAFVTTNPLDFKVGDLGFARLRFRFPASTPFPCLPVRAPHGYGLIYPLEGVTSATAAEIAVAARMGAQLDILHGVVVPWVDDDTRPFETVIDDTGRRRAEHAEGTLLAKLWKQVANTIYGKIAQAVRSRMVYNSRDGGRHPLPPSEITCPYHAAYITGLIRALMSEILADLPVHRSVVAVTTDAILTDATLDELPLNGPVSTFYADARQRLSGERKILGIKYRLGQLLSWRTRGIATPRSLGGEVKLAKGGIKVPADIASPNDWIIERMLERQPGDAYIKEQPLPFPKAHEEAADHVFVPNKTKLSFEYDWKRELVDPHMMPVEGDNLSAVSEHIAASSRPWSTLAAFLDARGVSNSGATSTAVSLRRWTIGERGRVSALARQHHVRACAVQRRASSIRRAACSCALGCGAVGVFRAFPTRRSPIC